MAFLPQRSARVHASSRLRLSWSAGDCQRHQRPSLRVHATTQRPASLPSKRGVLARRVTRKVWPSQAKPASLMLGTEVIWSKSERHWASTVCMMAVWSTRVWLMSRLRINPSRPRQPKPAITAMRVMATSNSISVKPFCLAVLLKTRRFCINSAPQQLSRAKPDTARQTLAHQPA